MLTVLYILVNLLLSIFQSRLKPFGFFSVIFLHTIEPSIEIKVL